MSLPRHALLLALLALMAPWTLLYGDEAAAKAKLLTKGIRVTKSGLSLSDEAELAKAFGELAQLKKRLTNASRDLNAIEREDEQAEEDLRGRMRANVELNTQLTNSGQRNVYQHNQLVAAVNANASAINLLARERDKSKKDIDEIRRSTNSVREDYVQRIMQVRTLVDRISGKYGQLAKDETAQAALKEWNDAAGTSFDIAPSHLFQSNLKRIEALERSVITENIALRREGNNFYTSVVINGKHTQEMMLDTGASSVVLPYKVAVDCGLNVEDSPLKRTAIIADGSKVQSTLINLDTIRVGKFSADNVECLVLPQEAKNAPLLLGMSFLGRFNFSINGSELVLSKVDAETGTAVKPKKTSSAHPPKRSTRRSRQD